MPIQNTITRPSEFDPPEDKWETVQIQQGEELERKYTIMEEVGKGRFGLVKRVLEAKTGEIRAAKYVRTVKRQDRESVAQEVDIMNSLRHPLLLRLIAAFELPKDIVLIMEYVSGGELFERVAADDFTLTERDCILFMRQICEAVAYIHSQSIVHLDLKPENIMCTSRSCHVIKIIDFGLAKRITANSELKVMLGTPEFIPPEIVNYEPVGFQSDMWSVGVIAYVLLSGLSPFMGDNDTETFANITRAQYDYDDEAFDNISEDAKDFISQLLVKRKDKRLTAEECLHHKWISQGDDTMSQVKLSTEKLKKFIIRRKWQKTGNAIRALGRMANLSRRNGSPARGEPVRTRGISDRSDSGFSEALPGQTCPGLDSSIEEEDETHTSSPAKTILERLSPIEAVTKDNHFPVASSPKHDNPPQVKVTPKLENLSPVKVTQKLANLSPVNPILKRGSQSPVKEASKQHTLSSIKVASKHHSLSPAKIAPKQHNVSPVKATPREGSFSAVKPATKQGEAGKTTSSERIKPATNGSPSLDNNSTSMTKTPTAKRTEIPGAENIHKAFAFWNR